MAARRARTSLALETSTAACVSPVYTSPRDRGERAAERCEPRAEFGQSCEMQSAAGCQRLSDLPPELDVNATLILGVVFSPDGARVLGPVDQSDDAVMAQQQRARELGERRTG
jgi:hypothetical protein